MTPDQQPSSQGFESKDINFPVLVILLISMIVLAIFSMVISIFMDRAFAKYSPMHDQPASPMARLHQLPPLPRLQPNPGIDMIRMRADTSNQLTTYGWVDRASGQVRIPIAEAMAKVAQEGLPFAKDKDAR